ncbi:hypothetical protein ACH42_12105 [Endozoicomonas sp. (ex Bugula neritina AB1)]|nr:hypothetical protein ACH42_12105 [Endozoicomonas sp. (ex Bugula neritina AB1)]
MARTLFLVAGSVLLAQLIVWSLWQIEWRSESKVALEEVSRNMALRVSSTVEYFHSLPNTYRHIVLDQLREVRGGTYFVTLNRERIAIDSLPVDGQKALVIKTFTDILKSNTSVTGEISIAFSDPDALHVFNNETLLKDLPEYWGARTLLSQPYNPPILVLQIPITEKEWLYVATTMPASLLSGENAKQNRSLRFFGMILLALLLLLTALKVREIIRPFDNLAKAAAAFGKDLTPVPLPARGSKEITETIHAFNQMQDNIRQYMNDRKALFGSISHDLKTPLTRLRLRVAMMDELDDKEAMEQDLDYLDLMIKSALQIVRSTDIHENAAQVSIYKTLTDIAASYPDNRQVIIHKKNFVHYNPSVVVKPLALRRCLENLIDNAIRYGSRAEVDLQQRGEYWVMTIIDSGPGIPEGMEKDIFKPYLRLDHGRKKNPSGNGLGLMTSRHLARTHGGDLEVKNRPEGGLEVSLSFPI